MLLSRLVEAARERHTSQLCVLEGNEFLLDVVFGPDEGGPVPIMSLTKTVTGMAVGRAVTLGCIDSIDTPVAQWFPEWGQGRKRLVTLRHLLTHTSGLQNEPSTMTELMPAPDVAQLALCAELTEEPGSTWRYNNKAVALIPLLVQRATQRPFRDFVNAELLAPAGCDTTTWWGSDSTGLPLGFANLALTAHDLALVLNLLVNEGRSIDGEPILDPSWVNLSLHTATPVADGMGLLAFISVDAEGHTVRAHHDGDGGQWYVLDPSRRRVTTRLVRWDRPEINDQATIWPDFPDALTG